MDAFESLMATLLEREGYWIRNSFKVDLTKVDKVAIGRPTSPRWEIDLVAYKAKDNELLIVECKSYLDSRGVGMHCFDKTDNVFTRRFKLFNDSNLKRVVLSRLKKQMLSAGLCSKSPSLRLCLATGKIPSEKERKELNKLFIRKKWLLYDDRWIRERVKAFSSLDYENNVGAVVAKILLRNKE